MGKGEGHTEEKMEEESRKRNADTKEDRALLGGSQGSLCFTPDKTFSLEAGVDVPNVINMFPLRIYITLKLLRKPRLQVQPHILLSNSCPVLPQEGFDWENPPPSKG